MKTKQIIGLVVAVGAAIAAGIILRKKSDQAATDAAGTTPDLSGLNFSGGGGSGASLSSLASGTSGSSGTGTSGSSELAVVDTAPPAPGRATMARSGSGSAVPAAARTQTPTTNAAPAASRTQTPSVWDTVANWVSAAPATPSGSGPVTSGGPPPTTTHPNPTPQNSPARSGASQATIPTLPGWDPRNLTTDPRIAAYLAASHP
jgi:hypothetical protein